MLAEMIKEGFGNDLDLNCAEKILYGANEAYGLGLDKESLKLAAGFGGGMGIESVCGALTASVMVLSRLFVKKNAHESTRIKELSQKLFSRYRNTMGDMDCAPLKAAHRTEKLKCRNVILRAAEILDELVSREMGNE